ncbi:benzyl alcohol o-benzoyltransferase [Quercus suber]|uniref:Benzyl alcohol o-benzoyltransferase n=1 Tax=Quercus suber TaxID=58331 RepID=A0AAW0KGD0_QUESU
MWRCHTIALRLNPEDDVRLIYIVNVRDRFCPRLPAGYYGNAIVASAILTTVGKLCQNPIEYALELVKTAKTNVSEEYARSLIDLMARPRLARGLGGRCLGVGAAWVRAPGWARAAWAALGPRAGRPWARGRAWVRGAPVGRARALSSHLPFIAPPQAGATTTPVITITSNHKSSPLSLAIWVSDQPQVVI